MGIKKYFLFIAVIAFFSVFIWFCKSDEGGAYCIGCNPVEPDTSELTLKITINSENPKVPIEIYNGNYNFENPVAPFYVDTVDSAEFKIKVPTNKTYSAKAIYKSGNRTIKAIDGAAFNREEQTGCEIACWQLYGSELDLRLKEY